MPSPILTAWIELASTIATLVGIPVGIGVFLWERKKERRQKKLEAFFQSNDRYMAFLDKIFENPELNCGEFRTTDDDLKNSGFSVKQLTLFTQLILILEQAWYAYHAVELIKVDDYWNAWQQTFKFWAKREDFQRAWELIDPNVESGFGSHMENLINSAKTQQCAQQSN